MSVAIIIPTWNRWHLITHCLNALQRDLSASQVVEPVETLVVDNGSADRTKAAVNAFRWAKILDLPLNVGFAIACNRGAEATDADLLCFLNNDTEPTPGWLAPLVDLLRANPDIAAVGPKLVFPDGRIQCGGVETVYDAKGNFERAREAFRGKPGNTELANCRRDCVLTGACLLVRASAFRSVGGFHTGFYNGCEDVDLCLSLQGCGWRTVYEPASVVVHLESQSGPERFAKRDQNRELLRKRWSVGNAEHRLEVRNRSQR